MTITKILGTTLATAILGTALVGGSTALADSASTTAGAPATHERVDRAALDALRSALDR